MRSQIKYKISELSPEKRPRERLIKNGPSALTDAELLAIVLNTGIRKKEHKEDVLELSNRILKEYGSLSIANERNVKKLMERLEIPKVKACQIIACFELGRRFFARDKGEIFIREPKEVYEYLKNQMENLKKEQLKGLYLDCRNKLIYEELISLGTLTTNLIHPREVFRPAIEKSAAAIILVHNHPSGDPEPSEDDIKITQQLIEASKLINIEILDHIIIGKGKYISFKDKNLI